MIRPAFAAWLARSKPFGAEEKGLFSEGAGRAGLGVCHIDDRMMVAASHAIATPGRWIVGSLFRRGEATPLTEATLRASPGTVSAASELTRNHWGDYVAFGTSRDGRYALRAPFGSLPCYWHEAPDHVVLVSSVRLLGAFGGPAPAVDWHALGHFLAATDLRNGRTCLRGVEELGGGQAIEVFDRGIHLERHWSPWSWAERAQAFHNRDAAAEALAGAINTAVGSRLPVDVPAILLLSGGLDSSVVAAALASSGRRFTCLTMVVADAQGDERDHARAVSRHLKVPLVEVVRDPRQVDLTRPLACGLPRPTGAQFRQATFAAADDLARETGSALVVDGGGGDNMFCSLQSVAPVVDALFAMGNRCCDPPEIRHRSLLRQGTQPVRSEAEQSHKCVMDEVEGIVAIGPPCTRSRQARRLDRVQRLDERIVVLGATCARECRSTAHGEQRIRARAARAAASPEDMGRLQRRGEPAGPAIGSLAQGTLRAFLADERGLDIYASSPERSFVPAKISQARSSSLDADRGPHASSLSRPMPNARRPSGGYAPWTARLCRRTGP